MKNLLLIIIAVFLFAVPSVFAQAENNSDPEFMTAANLSEIFMPPLITPEKEFMSKIEPLKEKMLNYSFEGDSIDGNAHTIEHYRKGEELVSGLYCFSADGDKQLEKLDIQIELANAENFDVQILINEFFKTYDLSEKDIEDTSQGELADWFNEMVEETKQYLLTDILEGQTLILDQEHSFSFMHHKDGHWGIIIVYRTNSSGLFLTFALIR